MDEFLNPTGFASGYELIWWIAAEQPATAAAGLAAGAEDEPDVADVSVG